MVVFKIFNKIQKWVDTNKLYIINSHFGKWNMIFSDFSGFGVNDFLMDLRKCLVFFTKIKIIETVYFGCK